MVLGSRHMLDGDPRLSLLLAGKTVEQVKQAKLLGITLDAKPKWSKHIDKLVSKMGKIAVTRKCSRYISQNILKEVIQALLLSHLEYCPVIWSSATKNDIKNCK